MAFAYPKCKNIFVYDGSRPYRDEVVRYLDLIATTDVGLILYKFIAQTTKSVQITWILGDDWRSTGASAISDSDAVRIIESSIKIEKERGLSVDDSMTAAMNEDAILQQKFRGMAAKGHPVMQEIRIKILEILGLHSTFMVPTKDIGTGAGIDVQLNYHPAAWRQLIKNTGRIAVGFGPGEVLYHELVHSLRMMAGLYQEDNVPERWNVDSFEEFCGIVAANMYRSARGFTTLRYDHRTLRSELPATLADPTRYYEEFKPEIVKWFNSQREFCVGLAGSCAPFNPMAIAADDLGISAAKC